MGVMAWENPAVRWPWTGVDVEEELRQLDRRWEEIQARHEQHVDDYRGLLDANREFMREGIALMQRAAVRQEKAIADLSRRTDDLIAEQREGREALFRILDRLPPAAGEA